MHDVVFSVSTLILGRWWSIAELSYGQSKELRRFLFWLYDVFNDHLQFDDIVKGKRARGAIACDIAVHLVSELLRNKRGGQARQSNNKQLKSNITTLPERASHTYNQALLTCTCTELARTLISGIYIRVVPSANSL